MLSSSSLVEILLNIVKTKVIALLAGTAGIGLMGLYQSLLNLLRSLSGVFAGAGVVQTVAGLNTEEQQQLYHALIHYVWRISLYVTLALMASSPFLANTFFGDSGRWTDLIGFALITPVVFLGIFWRSWLNGCRQIRSLAQLKIQATTAVVLASIILVYFFGIRGIYLAALFYPLPMAVLAWRYLRPLLAKQSHPVIKKASARPKHEIKDILATGKTLLASSVLFTLSVLLVKALINRELGEHALGLFQSSWTVAMVYIEILLVALGMDLFPRLSAAVKKHQSTTPLINQQLTFSLMLATPVILGMMLLAPWLLRWLYSAEFESAEQVLLWQLLGDFFKVPAWVLGYALIAHKKLSHSLMLQVVWVGIFGGVSAWLMTSMGVAAAGAAFALAYGVTAAISLLMVFWLGFQPNRKARRALALTTFFILTALFAINQLSYRSHILLAAFLTSSGISLYWLRMQWKTAPAETKS